MNATDREEFFMALTMMFETLGREASEAQVEGYWIGLSDLEFPDVKRALGRAIRECRKFVPTPAELRELAGVDSPESAAVLAWMELQKAIRIGPYSHVQFRDPVITATIRAMTGNWAAMCGRFAEGESEEKWIQKDFVRIYSVFASRGVGEEESAPLAGLSTGEYAKPVLVGKSDEQRSIGHQVPQGRLR